MRSNEELRRMARIVDYGLYFKPNVERLQPVVPGTIGQKFKYVLFSTKKNNCIIPYWQEGAIGSAWGPQKKEHLIDLYKHDNLKMHKGLYDLNNEDIKTFSIKGLKELLKDGYPLKFKFNEKTPYYIPKFEEEEIIVFPKQYWKPDWKFTCFGPDIFTYVNNKKKLKYSYVESTENLQESLAKYGTEFLELLGSFPQLESIENKWNTLSIYFEGIYTNTETDLRLNHLTDLQNQVTKAHMKNKKPIQYYSKRIHTTYATETDFINRKKMELMKSTIFEYDNGITVKIPFHKALKLEKEEKGRIKHKTFWKRYLHELRKLRKKQAEKNSLTELKKYNFKTGNRKQRRNKLNNWKQAGDRYIKYQCIPIKEKLIIVDKKKVSGEKVMYKDGKNILARINKISGKAIPYKEPLTTTVIVPKFMYVPFEKIYYKNVTIDDEIRKIETGRSTTLKKFLVDQESWDFTSESTFYKPVEYKTITQHLYPSYLRKLFKKRKEQMVELQKELQEIQEKRKKEEAKKKTDEKLTKKTTSPKKVVKSKQKKGG